MRNDDATIHNDAEQQKAGICEAGIMGGNPYINQWNTSNDRKLFYLELTSEVIRLALLRKSRNDMGYSVLRCLIDK